MRFFKSLIKELPQSLIGELLQSLIKELQQSLIKELPQSLIKELSQSLIKDLQQSLIKQLLQSLIKQLPQSFIKQLPQSLIKQLPQSLIKEFSWETRCAISALHQANWLPCLQCRQWTWKVCRLFKIFEWKHKSQILCQNETLRLQNHHWFNGPKKRQNILQLFVENTVKERRGFSQNSVGRYAEINWEILSKILLWKW